MTTPADALEAAGVTVYDHRVPPRPGTWSPVGVLWHHVGNTPPKALTVPAPSISLCQNGRDDLPGPLCQWLVDGAGGWNWITDGRANHAGSGDGDVLNWLTENGSRPNDPPRPNGDTIGGNTHLIGVEVEGNGHWSAVVHDSMIKGSRALLAHYGLPPNNVIGHKEWTTRKPDPAGIDMAAARSALLTPHPQPVEDDMAFIYVDKSGQDQGQVYDSGSVLVKIPTGDDAQALLDAGVKQVKLSHQMFSTLNDQAQG